MKTACITVLLILAQAAAAGDSCEVQIPASLRVTLGKAFPSFRAPLATDNSPEDIEWDLKEGRKGCLGVAIADFDGDGASDILLGLTPLNGSGGLLVAALARGGDWKIDRLSDWHGNRMALYVSVAEPGLYQRTEVLDGPLEDGEVDPLKCSHAAAIFGQIDSSGVAYCYNDQKWQHVWISD